MLASVTKETRGCNVTADTGEVLGGLVQGSVIDYPDGGGELSASNALRRKGQGSLSGLSEWRQYQHEVRDLGRAEADQRAEERRQARSARCFAESVRRARSRVRRILRYYDLTYMVTLTFPGGGVHEYDRALHFLQDFVHDHGELVRLDGKYVAVPELHPGGHGWQLARPGVPSLHALRACFPAAGLDGLPRSARHCSERWGSLRGHRREGVGLRASGRELRVEVRWQDVRVCVGGQGAAAVPRSDRGSSGKAGVRGRVGPRSCRPHTSGCSLRASDRG